MLYIKAINEDNSTDRAVQMRGQINTPLPDVLVGSRKFLFDIMPFRYVFGHIFPSVLTFPFFPVYKHEFTFTLIFLSASSP